MLILLTEMETVVNTRKDIVAKEIAADCDTSSIYPGVYIARLG
jgi:hypothetical protein